MINRGKICAGLDQVLRSAKTVRRIGSGCGYAGERPALTGVRCASVHGFSLHANVSVPAHRRDQLARLIRSTARGAVSLERLETDAKGDLLSTFTRPWSDGTTGLARSPLARLEQRGTLRIIATITHVDVIRKILCHGKLAAEPPPIAPARAGHATFAWTSP